MASLRPEEEAEIRAAKDNHGTILRAFAELLRLCGYLEPKMSQDETTRIDERVKQLVHDGTSALKRMQAEAAALERVATAARHYFAADAIRVNAYGDGCKYNAACAEQDARRDRIGDALAALDAVRAGRKEGA